MHINMLSADVMPVYITVVAVTAVITSILHLLRLRKVRETTRLINVSFGVGGVPLCNISIQM